MHNEQVAPSNESDEKEAQMLAFLLASLWYPKVMTKTYSDSQTRRVINQLHSTFSSFSLRTLEYLFSWPAF